MLEIKWNWIWTEFRWPKNLNHNFPIRILDRKEINAEFLVRTAEKLLKAKNIYLLSFRTIIFSYNSLPEYQCAEIFDHLPTIYQYFNKLQNSIPVENTELFCDWLNLESGWANIKWETTK